MQIFFPKIFGLVAAVIDTPLQDTSLVAAVIDTPLQDTSLEAAVTDTPLQFTSGVEQTGLRERKMG